MRILITAGPTREPIDPVRYIGNRSSGRMGAAIATAALKTGHSVTLILGPVTVDMPQRARRLDVETARQMYDTVMAEFPAHDLLIMAAAVADYRPTRAAREKLARSDALVIQCEPTEDIVATVALRKRLDQRIIGFSLESQANVDRAREKLSRKQLDMIVYNPIETINSASVRPTVLWPDGRTEELAATSKERFAVLLLERATGLFAST